MLLPNNIYNQIDDIVERSYTSFIYDLLGREFLTSEQQIQVEALGLLVGRKSLLELLYLLVKQRSEERYQDNKRLQELLESVFATGVLDQLPRTAQMTIDNAHHSMNRIVEKTKNEVRTRIKHEISSFNKEEKNYIQQVSLRPSTPSAEKLEKRHERRVGTLMAAIGVAVLAANKLFHRDFTGELTNFVNSAAADTAIEKYRELPQVLVYKKVVNDTHLCEYCHKSYVNSNGSPKVYKLKELMKNGTNDGKPKSQWKPVVGAHHPRCRCQLIVLGSDFDQKSVD